MDQTIDPSAVDALAIDPAGTASILSMILNSGPVVFAVLVVLIALSVLSWAITISKILQFRRARIESAAFSAVFWQSRDLARVDDTTRRLSGSPLTQIFSSGYKELTQMLARAAKKGKAFELSSVERALKRSEFEEAVKLERGLTFLASTASSAPFIGLFGTVWGIMNAFHGLGVSKSNTIQAVAPGISEALVATAIGLAAAIPAAVAYNYSVTVVRQFREAMDKFSAEFMSIAKEETIYEGD